MQANRETTRQWAWLALGACLVLPSLGVVERYARFPGVVMYVAGVAVTLWALERWAWPLLARRLTERQALLLSVLLFVVAAAVVAAVHPLADSGALGGGSDRDEAIDIGVAALLRGEYPYRLTTYLDNHISPLPGAFLLAAPFVLLFGTSAYQNLVWLVVFYLVVRRYYVPDYRDMLVLEVVLLALSPVLWQELVTGGDLLANSLYVFAFAVWMSGAHRDEQVPRWQAIASAVLFGVGLASRPNYVIVLLPVAICLAESGGWAYAARHIGLSLTVLALLVLPFYLYDRAGFTPLRTVEEIAQFGVIVPFAGAGFILLMLITALALALTNKPLDPARFLWHAALPQSVPVILGLAVYAYLGSPLYAYASFGLSFMFFGVVAAWSTVAGHHPQGTPAKRAFSRPWHSP